MAEAKWTYNKTFKELKLMGNIGVYVKNDSVIYGDETLQLDTIWLRDTKAEEWVQIVHNGIEFINTGKTVKTMTETIDGNIGVVDRVCKVIDKLM